MTDASTTEGSTTEANLTVPTAVERTVPPKTSQRTARPRRKHAAMGGRVLAVGLSTSAALLLSVAMAQSTRTVAATAAPPAEPAPIVVKVVLTNGGSTVSPAVAAPVASVPPASAQAPTKAPTRAPVAPVRVAAARAKAPATAKSRAS